MLIHDEQSQAKVALTKCCAETHSSYAYYIGVLIDGVLDTVTAR